MFLKTQIHTHIETSRIIYNKRGEKIIRIKNFLRQKIDATFHIFDKS